MIQVTLYSREDCHLCQQAEADLQALQSEFPHQLVVVDVDSSPALQRQYGFEVPVVEIGALLLRAPISPAELRQALALALAQPEMLADVPLNPPLDAQTVSPGQTILPSGKPVQVTLPTAGVRPSQLIWTRSDGFTYWFSRHWLAIINTFFALYVFLPFFAPILLQAGYATPAGLIYRVYGTTCHQLAYRSFFLFGEQPVYPRAAANVEGLLSFSEATSLSESSEPSDVFAAREFTGNPAMGFKVALCERDIALYGSILLFGLIFAATGRRIPPLPWYLWLLFGILPVAVDGLSQLFSQPPLSFIPYRESTPFLRMLTGGLFGFMTAWFGIPIIDQSFRETREMMEAKLRKVQAAEHSKQAGQP
jgi:uncharacterized membrane protein